MMKLFKKKLSSPCEKKVSEKKKKKKKKNIIKVKHGN